MSMLVAATLVFLATHFVTSTPLRGVLVRSMGEWPYRGLYSAVAFVTLGWIVLLVTTAASPTKQGLHDRIANSAIVQPIGREGPVTACLILLAALASASP